MLIRRHTHRSTTKNVMFGFRSMCEKRVNPSKSLFRKFNAKHYTFSAIHIREQKLKERFKKIELIKPF